MWRYYTDAYASLSYYYNYISVYYVDDVVVLCFNLVTTYIASLLSTSKTLHYIWCKSTFYKYRCRNISDTYTLFIHCINANHVLSHDISSWYTGMCSHKTIFTNLTCNEKVDNSKNYILSFFFFFVKFVLILLRLWKLSFPELLFFNGFMKY